LSRISPPPMIGCIDHNVCLSFIYFIYPCSCPLYRPVSLLHSFKLIQFKLVAVRQLRSARLNSKATSILLFTCAVYYSQCVYRACPFFFCYFQSRHGVPTPIRTTQALPSYNRLSINSQTIALKAAHLVLDASTAITMSSPVSSLPIAAQRMESVFARQVSVETTAQNHSADP